MFPFFFAILFLLSAFIGGSTAARNHAGGHDAAPVSMAITITTTATENVGIALDARASADYYPGYNNTCVSWHIEPSPDNTQLNLVAKCEGGNPAVDSGMVCSQIDLNRCYYESEGWLLPIDDNNTDRSSASVPKDKLLPNQPLAAGDSDGAGESWYPSPCHSWQLMPTRAPDGTVWDPIGHQMLFQCNVPHLAPMPEGYTGMWVNLALTVGNSGGTLFCPRAAGSSGAPSTRCR